MSQNPSNPVELRCEEAQSLVSRDLDRELAAADRARLDAHLAACPACAREKAALAGADALLRDALPRDAFGADFARDVLRAVEHAPRTEARPEARPATRGAVVAFADLVRSRGAGLIAASAAAVLFFSLATGSLFGPAPHEPGTHPAAGGPAIVARAYGKGLRVTGENTTPHLLAQGETVRPDEAILNTSGAGTLFIGDASRIAAFQPERGDDPELTRVDLRPDTTLSFHVERDGGTTVSLTGIGGVAYFEVAKQEHPFRVASSQLLATVMGTKFVVEASQQASTVAVVEGRVRVTSATQHVVLSARQEASFAASQGILVARPSAPRSHLGWNPRVIAKLPLEPATANAPAPVPSRSPIEPAHPGKPVIDPNLDTPVGPK